MAGYRELLGDTLRTLGDKARELGESSGVRDIYARGAERAKSYARLAKLTIASNSDAEELRKAYTELGKLCYERGEPSPDAATAALFARIGELRESLRKKEEEIRAMHADYESKTAETPEMDADLSAFEDVVNATENDGSGEA